MTEFRDHFAHSPEQKEPDKAVVPAPPQKARIACFPGTPPLSSLHRLHQVKASEELAW